MSNCSHVPMASVLIRDSQQSIVVFQALIPQCCGEHLLSSEARAALAVDDETKALN